jgi:hypothetical protein
MEQKIDLRRWTAKKLQFRSACADRSACDAKKTDFSERIDPDYRA